MWEPPSGWILRLGDRFERKEEKMQETVRESYYKKNYLLMEGYKTPNGQIVKKKSDGSLWVAQEVVSNAKCARRTLRSLTRNEARQLGLA